MPGDVHVSRLALGDFRNYASLSVDLSPGAVVLTGENGAGKTNLLEALSLLTPGRGLRRANLEEVARVGSPGFAVHATVETPSGTVSIGTGTSANAPGETGRKVRINGTPARSADEMLDWLRVLWLTPAMDALFTGPAGDRRRFLDRLVLSIDPAHGRRAADYEKAMRGRNRLLSEERADPAWLDAIEIEMAETGMAMVAARAEMVRFLDQMIARQADDSPFPKAEIALEGEFDTRIGSVPAVELEEEFRAGLRQGRARDRAAGRALQGPHRSDLAVRHGLKQMPAASCSTGEQKALLIGLVLSHARLTGELNGAPPLLLLDEIGAHLDADRRAALFALLAELGCQHFMTGTERQIFSALEGRAQFLSVSGGHVAA